MRRRVAVEGADFHMALWMLARRSDLGPAIELLRTLYDVVDDWAARRFLRKLEQERKVEISRAGRQNFYRAIAPVSVDDIVAAKKERQDAGWGGRWCLVTYDLPQDAAGMRKRLIRSMRRVGMGRLNQSTWVSPYDWSETVSAEASARGGATYLDWIRDGDLALHCPVAEAVHRMWPLKRLSGRYREIAKRARALAESSLGRAGLRNALRTVRSWAVIEAEDPMLPAELLPSDWPSADVRDAVLALRRRVSQTMAGVT